jgi:hypothetical protein
MREARWRHGRLPEGLGEEGVDVVKLSRVFKARLVPSAYYPVKLSMDLGLQ